MATEYENVEDELGALINGSYDAADEESETNDEDTDHTEPDETETDTTDEAAEPDLDTDDGELDDGEENTPVDEGSSEELEEETEDEGESEDESEEEVDEAEGDEDKSETEVAADGAETENTDEIDYKKQYEELIEKSKVAMDFHEKVAGVEIKANGKMIKSFIDPDKILQSQQKMYNYSDKMAGFKQYRPYIGPLKDRGMIEDPAKFDLAMSLADGNVEALKQHIKDLNIDPMSLDMDEINYAGESMTASRELLEIEDALDVAGDYGVKDRVFDTVMKQWDDESYAEFAKNPDIQHDLAAQMASGAYDDVMSRVEQTAVLDTRFAAMSKLKQYNTVAQQINTEKMDAFKADEASKVAVKADEVKIAAEQEVTAEATRKTEAEAAVKYKAEVARKNKVAKEARDKAARASKDKLNRSNKGSKAEDPMKFDGKGLENFYDNMIMGKK